MNKRFVYIICLIMLFAAGGCKRGTGLPDLNETYLSGDTKPFGGNVAFRIIQNSFPENYVRPLGQSFDEVINSFEDTASLYFCISRSFYANEGDVDGILDFVDKGNTFFLSAANIDTVFLEKIYCKIKTEDEIPFSRPFFRKTSVRLTADLDSAKTRYSYFYSSFASYFSGVNSIYSRVLGYNNAEEPNCIVFFWGKGKIFIHTDPRVFSNYFLLTNNNYTYLQELLQVMDQSPEHIYWNDRTLEQENPESGEFFGLNAILKSPPLAAAFWLAVLTLLLFVLFGIKRRQRVIKEIQPNVNSSVAFTETIARLYLQENDNKNIADKMVTYFNDFVRSNYFLHVNAGSEDFISSLSRKSGVSLEKTTRLYQAINEVAQKPKINDKELLDLNNQIQQFYKNRK